MKQAKKSCCNRSGWTHRAHSQRRLVGTRWVMLLLRATLLLQLLASSHGGGGASREPLELVWSSPTLVDAPSAANPAGPHGSPDNFVALDSRHFFGGEGSFSSDGGKTWALQQWARPDPYAMYPLLPVQGKLQTVGGPSTERTDGWDLQYPMRYAVNASSGVIDKTSVVGTVGPNKTLVTFSGIPYPGVNISNPWKIRPGGRTYGALQMANGEYLMTTCVMWNGLREEQAPPHEGLLPKFGFVRTRTHTCHLAMRSRTTVSTPPLLGACMRVWLLHVDTDVCGCVHVQGCADLDVRFSGRQRKLDEAGRSLPSVPI